MVWMECDLFWSLWLNANMGWHVCEMGIVVSVVTLHLPTGPKRSKKKPQKSWTVYKRTHNKGHNYGDLNGLWYCPGVQVNTRRINSTKHASSLLTEEHSLQAAMYMCLKEWLCGFDPCSEVLSWSVCLQNSNKNASKTYFSVSVHRLKLWRDFPAKRPTQKVSHGLFSVLPDDPPEYNKLYAIPALAFLSGYGYCAQAGTYPDIHQMAYLAASLCCVGALTGLSSQTTSRLGKFCILFCAYGGRGGLYNYTCLTWQIWVKKRQKSRIARSGVQ